MEEKRIEVATALRNDDCLFALRRKNVDVAAKSGKNSIQYAYTALSVCVCIFKKTYLWNLCDTVL